MKFEFPHHTVVLLAGPTGCGKSTLLENISKDLIDQDVDHAVLSSDEYRRLLLGGTPHKHDPCMLEVSEQAFKCLMSDLEIHTSYPINIPLIFIDTRGFDPVFRKEVSEVARRNKYSLICMTFEFKNASDYWKDLPEKEAEITRIDVNKFRRKVLADIRARDYDKLIKVRNRDQVTEPVEVYLPDLIADSRSLIPPKSSVAVIGDSHESVEELGALIDKILVEDPDTAIIHVGDYLDKGQDTLRMLDYMAARVMMGDKIVDGNHESYVYRRLKGDIKPAAKEIEEEYFTSLAVLQANEPARNLFFNLYENHTLPFAKVVKPGQRTVYVTHAPCNESYLGKHSFEARKAQRNLYVKHRDRDVREGMDFIFKQASPIKAMHVFGHVSHSSKEVVYKNKVFLDTGAVNGHQLSAFVMKDNFYRIVQVASEKRGLCKVLPDNLTRPEAVVRPFNIYDYDLSPEDIKFLNRTMKNGVKYISGTMAPAPSTQTELEPLSSAFDFFRSRGVEKVVLEPKYMGSRCQFYLSNKEDVPSFAVSRNGYVIKHVDGLPELLKEWEEKCKDWYDGFWSQIILDGELLPWSALGKGLIDSHFNSYGSIISSELNTLAEDEEFAKLDIAENYDCTGRLAELEIFKETLGLYSKDTPLEFRAFNILCSDGGIVSGDPECMFEACNSDPALVVDLSSELDLVEAAIYFNGITVGRGMEGIVVKPYVDQYNELPARVPEYMKVRNERYLTLVYGYDYKRRYHKLVSQKNISGKVAVSIRESKIGREMLTASEDKRRELIVKMISELKTEKTLDPRL